jgi:beta-phosphoglucomutase
MGKIDITKYKCFLFDWDGTLVNSIPAFVAMDKHILQSMGVKKIRDDFVEIQDKIYNDRTLKSLISTWCEYLNMTYHTNLEPKQLKELRAKHGAKFLSKIDFVPFALEFIKKLKQSGKSVALVTSSIQSYLDCYNKIDFSIFDEIVTRDLVTEAKPSPIPYLKAVELLKVDKKDCLIFEDSIVGVQSGANADIDICVIGNLETPLAKYNIKSYGELL